MEKILQVHLQEVIFGSPDSKISKQISKLEKKGTIRKIAPRLYTSNLTDPVEEIIRRNLFIILGNLFPGALLSHRSALEFKPTESGQIFLTYKYTKKISLGGININFLKGPAPIAGDILFAGALYVSQKERAFLENLQISKKMGSESKTLKVSELEDKLEQIIRINGEKELNKTRDTAQRIAEKLSMQKEFEKLNKLISALLTTHNSRILSSPLAIARAFGAPYDPARIELFEILYRELQTREFKKRPDKNISNKAFRNFAFFESYFSNYIEGTVFNIKDAQHIIATNKPFPARNDDSHDILGTFHIVSNKREMSVVPETSDELITILKYRHKILLQARKDKNPGLFKDINNFAGQTFFVDFNLVQGTLIKSYDFYRSLTSPFTKACFMMFFISEIHPFTDGNGRIARVMMNAELVKQGQSKIIIPTVFREDYLLTLRKLTRKKDPDPYIRMMEKAHEFSENIHGEDMKEMQNYLEKSNAFLEYTEGKLRIVTG